ncbi:DUF3471 domain-containing protein [Roseivirga sp.]|uniref:DUF3471 domain-containing protein n=1 Tax=Roseivirga sp. TaxID=1964215 RepID=UPI003B8B5222
MKQVNNFSRVTAMTLILTLLGFSAFGQTAAAKAESQKKENELKAYTGTYEFDNEASMGFDIKVWLDDEGTLFAQPSNESQPQAQLSNVSEDKFELLNTGGLIISFKKDEKKKVISLTISEGGQSFTCIKKEDK